MADSYVQVAPDSTGKQIDSDAVINTSGMTVYRQCVTIGDDTFASNVVNVDLDGILAASNQWDRLKVALLTQQLLLQQAQAQLGAGFVPMEVPSFLAGV